MKKYLFSLVVLCAFSHFLSAQNTIVRVRGGVSTTFNNLDDALIDQADDDRLTLSGGVFTTSKAIIKGIHITGAGYDTRVAGTGATGFTRVTSDIYVYSGSDNGSIEGINFDRSITFGNGTTTQISNFLVKNNSIERIYVSTNCTVSRLSGINCIFNYIYAVEAAGSLQYSLISNSIILQRSVINTASINNLFDHNIFYCGFYPQSGISAYYCIFTNNIFQVFDISPANFCVFKNNIKTPQSGTNTVTNAIDANWDVTFVRLGLTNGYALYAFEGTRYYNNEYDYHLKSSSIGKNAATDGSDVGIYGGPFAWKEYGIPSNPHIVSKNISSTTNATTGKLHVEITVEAQDH